MPLCVPHDVVIPVTVYFLQHGLTLNHSIVGSGLPSTLQFSVAGSFFFTTKSVGCSIIRGD